MIHLTRILITKDFGANISCSYCTMEKLGVFKNPGLFIYTGSSFGPIPVLVKTLNESETRLIFCLQWPGAAPTAALIVNSGYNQHLFIRCRMRRTAESSGDL